MAFIIKKSGFLPAQQKWWDIQNFIRLFVSGYGGGKTHIGALRTIENSHVNSGIPNSAISPTFEMARRTSIPAIEGFLDRAGVRYTHNKSSHELFIYNWDGFIFFGSGDNPDSLKGSNIATAWVDEPFLQKKAVIEQVLARCRHPEAVRREINLTGTAEELNWGYEIATSDAEKWDVGLVTGSTRDNLHLPSDYVERMVSAYTDEQIAAYIDGQFVNLTVGRVCKPFNREQHIRALPNLDKLITEHPIEFGIDFNVDYLTAEVYLYLNGHFHFFDEIRLSNATTFDAAEAIRAKYPRAKFCYPDATGNARKTSSTKSDHSILRDYGFNVQTKRSNPPVRDRVNAWNRLLKLDRISIEPNRCKWLVADNERMTWRGGDLDKIKDPSLSHGFDAGSYPVIFKHPVNRGYVGTFKR